MGTSGSTRLMIVAAIALVFSIPLSAHHGEANYEVDKVVTVTGTVTEFRFINPHVLVSFDVKGENGAVTKWVGEATSPNLLLRRGWDKDTLKVGDRITASGHQAKNGSPTLRLLKIVLADGTELGDL